jgi:hypothetical protein
MGIRKLASLKMILVHSDDWGLAGWTPTREVAAALGYDTMPFPLPEWGFSRQENESDLDALFSMLMSFRDGAGLPPIVQANYIVASINYRALVETGALSFCELPQLPEAWESGDIIRKAREGIAAGVWWPEFHGYTHCNASRVEATIGSSQVKRALELGCPPFHDPEAYLEYKSSLNFIQEGLHRFEELFCRAAISTVPPNYIIGYRSVFELIRHGVRIFQAPERWVPLDLLTKCFAYVIRYLPFSLLPVSGVRRDVDFEPRGTRTDPEGRPIWTAALNAAIDRLETHNVVCISTHRINYAHHQNSAGGDSGAPPSPGRSGLTGPAYVDALGALIGGLLERYPDAVFLTDYEYVRLRKHGISFSQRGSRSVFRNITDSPRMVSLKTNEMATLNGLLTDKSENPIHVVSRGREFVQISARPGTYVLSSPHNRWRDSEPC